MSFMSKVKGFGRFLISKFFLINASIALVLIVCLFWFVSFWLTKYTEHGQSLVVPDFRGLTIAEAAKLASEKNVGYQVIDSNYSSRGARGAIIEQNPQAGFRVKTNRTIFFTINAWSQEKVKAPNVLRISVLQAKADLESAGLTIGRLIFVPSEYPKLVLRQIYNGDDFDAGFEIPKNSTVDLVVGKGFDDEESKTIVPNLMGLTLEQARNRATRSLLNVGSVRYDNTVSTYADSLKAIVWEQNPVFTHSGDLLFGDSISLNLTLNENKVKISELSAVEKAVDVQVADSINDDEEDIIN